MEFRAVAVVKLPRRRVWTAIRDEMPALAAHLDSVQNVTVLEREQSAGGKVHLVNQWQARLPASFVSSKLGDVRLGIWLDHATWDEPSYTCRWRIEHPVLGDRLTCEGEAIYEEAMGGSGTRVRFGGVLSYDARGAGSLPVLLEGAVSGGVEALVQHLIPKNLRRTVEAVERYVAAQHGLPAPVAIPASDS